MTIAVEQCREYIDANWPGVRISRQSCRDTASGFISQHSAYQPGDYDSNALDIMGGPTGWTWEQNVELIQAVVDDIGPYSTAWSVRKILWQVPLHYGHAHIDFYPMIDMARWCSTFDITPAWKYSDGHTERHLNPSPENGAYNGASTMPTQQWHQFIQALFDVEDSEFQGDPNYWKLLSPDSPEWVDFWNAAVRQMSK